MQENGKFPIIKDNDLYLLKFVQTEESKAFLESLRNRLHETWTSTYDSDVNYQKEDVKLLEEVLYYDISKDYVEMLKENSMSIDYLYPREQKKIFHITSISKYRGDLSHRFTYQYQVEQSPYLVRILEKFLKSSYVNLQGLVQEYSNINSNLLTEKERLLSVKEVTNIIETYLSLLELEDIRTYFTPQMEVSLQKEETWDKKQPEYQAIYNSYDLETYYPKLKPILYEKIENLATKENGYQKKKVKEEENK